MLIGRGYWYSWHLVLCSATEPNLQTQSMVIVVGCTENCLDLPQFEIYDADSHRSRCKEDIFIKNANIYFIFIGWGEHYHSHDDRLFWFCSFSHKSIYFNIINGMMNWLDREKRPSFLFFLFIYFYYYYYYETIVQ